MGQHASTHGNTESLAIVSTKPSILRGRLWPMFTTHRGPPQMNEAMDVLQTSTLPKMWRRQVEGQT